MAKFNGFLDNLASGILGPKGNMADWQHASRLYVADNQKHAPKVKFLYHVTFYLTEPAKSVIPEVAQYTHEIGMLVKSADLPSFTAQVEVKNKYNRKKHTQSRVDYDPINISFFDDNYGATSALLEAYFKYYYADGIHTLNDGAYGNRRTGDTTYDGAGTNSFKFGLDNNVPSVPFFDRIEIAQLSRKSFTKYTLINPIITGWKHDTLDNSDNSGAMENQITLNYDTVFYDRGNVEAGANGDPVGFGRADHYDTTPSPISLLGGGTLGIDGVFGAGLDLYEYITKGKNFSNPLEAGIAAVNLFGNIRNLSSEGLRQQGYNILTNAIGNAAGIDVSGVAQTFFPKNGGNGGARNLLIATAVAGGLSAVRARVNARSTSTGDTSPSRTNDARFQNYVKDYLAGGGAGGVNGARAAFNALPDSAKANYDN
jgi:hypothetical protein